MNQPPSFTFDPVEHVYRVGGVVWPGVSDILDAAGLKTKYGGFQEAQWRGLHVHNATELYDQDDLDWNSVHQAWIGYVKAWAKFREERTFVPTLIEWQGYHPTLGFCGTVDREGTCGDSLEQLDIKTGTEEKWHRYQTAGYWILRQNKDAARGCVYISEDGTYRKVMHEDPSDIRVFMAALTIYNAKRGK